MMVHEQLELTKFLPEIKPPEIQFTKEQPRFDGGECEKKWIACGMPKGAIPDQYVETCQGGAVNLHIYRLGMYEGCFKIKVMRDDILISVPTCKYQKGCKNYAYIAGEQAEL